MKTIPVNDYNRNAIADLREMNASLEERNRILENQIVTLNSYISILTDLDRSKPDDHDSVFAGLPIVRLEENAWNQLNVVFHAGREQAERIRHYYHSNGWLHRSDTETLSR